MSPACSTSVIHLIDNVKCAIYLHKFSVRFVKATIKRLPKTRRSHGQLYRDFQSIMHSTTADIHIIIMYPIVEVQHSLHGTSDQLQL